MEEAAIIPLPAVVEEVIVEVINKINKLQRSKTILIILSMIFLHML